jgi:hypothetical protein
VDRRGAAGPRTGVRPARPRLAVGSGDFPALLRQQGAETIHWDNYLRSRVGLPTTPADPETIVDRANKLFDYAVQQSVCATPWIAENELSARGSRRPGRRRTRSTATTSSRT